MVGAARLYRRLQRCSVNECEYCNDDCEVRLMYMNPITYEVLMLCHRCYADIVHEFEAGYDDE